MIQLIISPKIREELRNFEQIYLNFAILLNQDLHILVDKSHSGASLHYQKESIRLDWCGLDRWETSPLSISKWHDCELPTPTGDFCSAPDILGLLWYLGTDQQERKYQASVPEGNDPRFWAEHGIFSTLYTKSQVDKAIYILLHRLKVSAARPYGIILTHDLDIVEAPQLTFKFPINSYRLLFKSENYLRLVKQIFSDAVHYFAKGRWGRDFEFMEWARLEEERGFKSIFFVFSPERRTQFPGDADYFFSTRRRGSLFFTIKSAMKSLLTRGFQVGLHLSRSSNYERKEIEREFYALGKSIGTPVKATRNHWVWIEYRNWYQYLKDLRIDFDFNICANGYAKLSAYPYFNSNKLTLTFPTIFLDDLTLKKKNLGLSRRQALDRIEQQFADLKKFGGIPAISFHPSEDGPFDQLYNICCPKIDVYEEILNLIKNMDIPVYLPDEAKRILMKKVTFSS